MEFLNKNIGKIAAFAFLILAGYAIYKGLLIAFETLPERVQYFTTQFNK